MFLKCFDSDYPRPILLAGDALVPLSDVDVGGETIAAAVKFVTPPFVLDMARESRLKPA